MTVTSDLSIDESLILHSIGWEPRELVSGVGTYSIPYGTWTWATGEIELASSAHHHALQSAVSRMQEECRRAGGHGVVGVHIDITIHKHYINAVLVGTAVAPTAAEHGHRTPFVSDLSARDFVLLHRGGWTPSGLAFGASFVYAPRRSLGATMRQSGQNVELTNYTEALYAARESAMERMQQWGRHLGGVGVVGVQVSEGPMHFASHAIRFTAWGTVLHHAQHAATLGPPRIVVPLNDKSLLFDVASLRGPRTS